MKKVNWDIDPNTKLRVDVGALGKIKVNLNDRPIFEDVKIKKNQVYKAKTQNGDEISLNMEKPMFGPPHFLLKVNEEIKLPDSKEYKKSCSSCTTENEPNSKFCEKCGNNLPSAEYMLASQKVNGARGGIIALAVMFALFGVVMFFIQKGQVATAMENLSQYQDSDVWSQPVNGKEVTVGELKELIALEQWSPLVLNGILSLIMIALSFWAKSNPLAAIIIAAGVYCVVIVGNAIYDPRSIGQGWIMKIIIISFLYNGIKSALALRELRGM